MQYELNLGDSNEKSASTQPQIYGCRSCERPKTYGMRGYHFCELCPKLQR